MNLEKIQDGKLYVAKEIEAFDLVTPESAIDIIDRVKAKGMSYVSIAARIGVSVQAFAVWRKSRPGEREIKPSTQAALRRLEREELQ